MTEPADGPIGHEEFAAKIEAYAAEAIEYIKKIPGAGLSGEDSGLDDVWEEFKEQVQHGSSIYMEMFNDTILDVCRVIVEKKPEKDVEGLWPQTEAFSLCDDDDGPWAIDEMQLGVARALFDRVWEIAGEENIAREEQA